MTSVLVLGGGGREHAIILALTHSPSVTRVLTMPSAFHIEKEVVSGSGEPVVGVDGDIEDPHAVLAAAQAEGVDLVVIGSAGPSASGVADLLRASDFAVFGVGRDGARLEQSKFAGSDFMVRHGIPTPASVAFDNADNAMSYASRLADGCAVKLNGFADGAGVFVCTSPAEAEAAISLCFSARPEGRVIIQERCTGPEFSVHAIVTATPNAGWSVLLDSAQDYKRLLDSDIGPNTGGIGSVSPVPWLSTDEYTEIATPILRRFVAGCRADGIDYRGIAYIPVMLSSDGPRVLEINVRFGNPEAQSLLGRMTGDLLPLLRDCALGTPGMEGPSPDWSADHAVTVASCVSGYPCPPAEEFDLIGELEPSEEGVRVFLSSGVREEGGRLIARTGRVLTATGLHGDLRRARALAYHGVRSIDFRGRYFRGDVAGAADGSPWSSGCGIIVLTCADSDFQRATASAIQAAYPRTSVLDASDPNLFARTRRALLDGYLVVVSGSAPGLRMPGWHRAEVNIKAGSERAASPTGAAHWVLTLAFAPPGSGSAGRLGVPGVAQ